MLKRQSNRLGMSAEIKKIEEISQIMERGVMMLPGDYH